MQGVIRSGLGLVGWVSVHSDWVKWQARSASSFSVLTVLDSFSYLSRSLADRWGTTVDFTTSFLHSSRFSAFRSMIFHSRPVHSLMLSSHRFHRLVGLVVRRPPRERKVPGSNPACGGICSGSSHTSDFKIGTPVATLPGAWRYRVSTGTGRPGVSIL